MNGCDVCKKWKKDERLLKIGEERKTQMIVAEQKEQRNNRNHQTRKEQKHERW